MQEKRETGRKRDVSDVIDSLLAFYAERGDLYKILRDGRGWQREGRKLRNYNIF
jgi:hypothetical protein